MRDHLLHAGLFKFGQDAANSLQIANNEALRCSLRVRVQMVLGAKRLLILPMIQIEEEVR